MHPETYKQIIELTNSVTLGFFGIGVTLFTIFYAFILDKKEIVEQLLNIQQTHKLSIYELRKLNFSRAIMKKYIKIVWLIKIIILLSFTLFILTFYYIITDKITKQHCIIALVFFTLIIITTIYTMYRFNRRYNRDLAFR